ncbi:MAG TPA: 5-guanidino-2-oxopentanoate decarboxylase [Steroidobacteraceae bacterium]|jgi:acetolactate synthase-1/2/3 large subunit
MRRLGLYLIEALQAQGVRHVFGIPGVHNLELYRGLAQGPIRHITGRHEQGLGFMADGYARVSGRPGVCFTITGPGLTNIATAMGQAYGDSIPMLVISSQNRLGEGGSGCGFLHELPNQRELASGVAAAAFSIRTPQELPGALGKAFTLFDSARPRPVYIEIPLDVLAADASGLPLPEVARSAKAPPASLVQSAAAIVRAARRPVILAGGGAIRAASELKRLAERLDAPTVMTANARGLLTPGHPLAVPISPMLAPVRRLIATADAVLAVGTEIGPTDYSLDMRADFPNPPQLVRIDIDPDQLTRGATPVLGICADSQATLSLLESCDLGPARENGGASRAAAARTDGLEALAAFSASLRAHVDLLELIRDTLPNPVLVGDSTQLVYAGNLGFNAQSPASWFNSATGYGTLGYALPASTGASLAAPDRPVVCLVGDGGLQFSLSELATLGDVGGWTAVLIWNNQGYGEIRTAMLQAGIEPEGVEVRPPDFAHLARAFGHPHRRITSRESLRKALQEFASRRRVVVLEIPAEEFS